MDCITTMAICYKIRLIYHVRPELRSNDFAHVFFKKIVMKNNIPNLVRIFVKFVPTSQQRFNNY